LASDSQYSLVEFMADFPDDETCLVWLWDTRFNLGDDTAHCERCGEIRTFRRYVAKQQRQDWTCTACGLHVHPTAGTIFHKSSTSLHLWFYAMYLMTSTRCGISAKQVERELGVTYKTAWRMCNLIRNQLMGQDDLTLSGSVEMDETYVGGKPRQSDKSRWKDLPTSTKRRQAAQAWSNERKVQVFGMVERQGNIAAHVVPSKKQATMFRHIERQVSPDAVVYTDDAAVYRRLPREHHVINHSHKIYAKGDVHTQTIESFWAQVKNATSGVHHGVSKKWLQSYVSEYAWRWNHRDDGRGMFSALILRAAFSGVR
jgi:transposase-like protein